MTTSALEERMARIEGAFEQIDRRLTTLEQVMHGGFQRVNGQIQELSSRLDGHVQALNSRIDRLMYWQLGLLGAIAASTVAIVLTR